MEAISVDERAAGVFLGADPYKELELYLEKVNEEIGEVFDRWRTTDSQICYKNNNHLKTNNNHNGTNGNHNSHSDAPRIHKINGDNYHISESSHGKEYKTINNKHTNDSAIYGTLNGSLNRNITKTKSNGAKLRTFNSEADRDDDDFSDKFLTEFNDIIAKKLQDLTIEESSDMPYYNLEVDETDSEPDYDEVFVSDDEEASAPVRNSRNSRSKSLEGAFAANSGSGCTNGVNVAQSNSTKPALFNYKLTPKTSLVNFLKKNRERVPSLTPPVPGDAVLVRVASLPDSDWVEPSSPLPDQLEGRRSTEPEIPKHFAKPDGEPLLTKRKFLLSRSLNNSPKLPPKHNKLDYQAWTNPKGKHLDSRRAEQYGTPDGAQQANKDINLHPFSSKDARIDSDSRPKERSDISPAAGRDSARTCIDSDFANKAGEEDAASVKYAKSPGALRAEDLHCPEECYSCHAIADEAGRPNSAGGYIKDAETQTHGTPPLSRSSSSTWASEGSSSIFNTGSTNASASDDEPATPDDDIGSSSSSGAELGGSGGQGGEGGEESGIGTASPPPRSRKDKDADQGQKALNKCKRKETWERLRRRQSNITRHPQYYRASTGNDVWVRRESVTTQTLAPEELDAIPSDHTCNTEDTSSNENLLMEDSINDTSMSENSLRRNIFSRKYNNEINQSSSGIDTSANMADETDEASILDSSAISLPTSYAKFKNSSAVRPTCLKLKIVNVSAILPMDSPNSSGDCLDDSRSFKDYLTQNLGREQPSPSTASLKLSMSPIESDLGNKCVSVPALLKKHSTVKGLLRRGESEDSEDSILQKPRAQSEKHLSEIEATEACKWLRAAGFPQYAQMYEDMQFPINVSGVQSDHPFLDPDSLQSLFRRLAALNRCADMKVEHQHAPKHTQHEDSDEENQCALSENWQYERKSRRWSRVVDISSQAQQRLQAIADRAIAEQNARDRAQGLDPDADSDPHAHPAPALALAPDLLTVPGQEGPESEGSAGGEEQQASRFRRSGSERLRDGAKAFLRRVESIKSRRRRRQNRDGVVISSPQVFDVMSMQQKMKDLNCIDISPTANYNFADFPTSPSNFPSSPLRSHPPSPLATMPPSPMTSTAPTFVGQIKLSPTPFGDDSSSYCSDGSQGSAHRSSARAKLGSRAKKFLHRNVRPDDAGALSDSECQPSSWRHHYFKDANSNDTKLVLVEPPSPPEESSGAGDGPSPPRSPPPVPAVRVPRVPRARSRSPAHRPAARTGSLNLGKESSRYRDKSFKREKSASRSELSGSQESAGSHSHDEAEDKVQVDVAPRQKGNVQRWHSFQRSSSLGSRPESSVVIPPPIPQHTGEDLGVRPMASMSCGQLQVLRKLALLKLTACMERYCPTHRTGWNWELPKFIRKIKAPDYKDKTVFGVPLLVSLQRTGHALPKPIQTALRWLRNNALDQVGIFRKAGVRSRTLRLRQLAESAGTGGAGHSSAPPPPPATLAPYDEQQAHDVADMVKQYFRELPDALLTNKLSETFIAIFQHVPPPMREDAVQCALLLLPEEHREALQVVLAFLQQVADHSATNQMTASNLAVCLAPTLLRLHHHQQGQGNSNKEGNSNRSASASPRRRRGGAGGLSGVAAPDPRELNESRAAHDCLLLLIKRHRELFTVSADTLQRCKFNSLEESIPVTLEELGSEFQQDWRGFQQASTQALLKEAREKSRGWVSVSTHEPHVELCYRKVGDGHPLRLWRVTTEVEAPPSEVLHRILRERHIWDDSLLKWRVVERLSTQAEVFQYLTASMAPLQAKDYCVLRSWQSDLPRGGCCVVETSVSHDGAPVLLGGVRAVVLASRYLIEPAGKGRSRLMHLARVDTKGRTPEWYNKSYGHLCALYSARIRASFKHNTDGPESNV